MALFTKISLVPYYLDDALYGYLSSYWMAHFYLMKNLPKYTTSRLLKPFGNANRSLNIKCRGFPHFLQASLSGKGPAAKNKGNRGILFLSLAANKSTIKSKNGNKTVCC
jgi:hypothetical protein